MIIASQIEPISPYVFSAGKPVLITVDPISSAILKIELAEKRRAAEPPGGGLRVLSGCPGLCKIGNIFHRPDTPKGLNKSGRGNTPDKIPGKGKRTAGFAQGVTLS